jgi:hypothetical protein
MTDHAAAPAPHAATSRIAAVCDEHGAAVLGLARLLVGEDEAAEAVSTQAILDACWPSGLAERRRLARHVYVLCARRGAVPHGEDDRQRLAIALARLGGHTYREVAELMSLPAAEVALLMRTGLHAAYDGS